mmetsp:Transcript_16299/g.42339  ORF Transcript_16299/g.42339 Transcript_16299/m.42339 type:complete len:310 (-) Transcript_16299:798-1727(-)
MGAGTCSSSAASRQPSTSSPLAAAATASRACGSASGMSASTCPYCVGPWLGPRPRLPAAVTRTARIATSAAMAPSTRFASGGSRHCASSPAAPPASPLQHSRRHSSRSDASRMPGRSQSGSASNAGASIRRNTVPPHVRPVRPARCFAWLLDAKRIDACVPCASGFHDTSMLLHRSMTYAMLRMVREDSATLVASTSLRLPERVSSMARLHDSVSVLLCSACTSSGSPSACTTVWHSSSERYVGRNTMMWRSDACGSRRCRRATRRATSCSAAGSRSIGPASAAVTSDSKAAAAAGSMPSVASFRLSSR